jgi:hypothetical protein
MARIPQEIIYRINATADIVDVVSKTVELKKRGRNFFGLCPFHDEKTPSFSVAPDKGIYHCFGCGKGGNVITFLQEYEGLNFVEAVERLAEFNNVTVPRSSNSNRSDHSEIYELNNMIADFYFSALKNNDKVGAILFTDDIELFIPPNKGKKHILRIIRELIEFKPKSSKTNINSSLKFLLSVIQKKAIVFILSDFIDKDYDKSLKLAAKKFDLTGIRIYDQMETKMVKIGFVPMIDAETNEFIWVDTSSKRLRENYDLNYADSVKYFETLFNKNGAGVINCEVDDSYVKKLLGYFKQR